MNHGWRGGGALNVWFGLFAIVALDGPYQSVNVSLFGYTFTMLLHVWP